MGTGNLQSFHCHHSGAPDAYLQVHLQFHYEERVRYGTWAPWAGGFEFANSDLQFGVLFGNLRIFKFIYMLKSMFRFFYISLFQFIFYLQGEASLVDASARPLRKRAWVMDIKNFANMMTVGWNGVP